MKKKQKGKDKKTKELMKFLKKGGEEGSKEDFQELLKKATKQKPFDKKKIYLRVN